MSYAEAYAIWCELVELQNPTPAQRSWILELEVLMDRRDEHLEPASASGSRS